MAFKKGVSGNPKGRPNGLSKAAKLRELIAPHAPELIQVLVEQAKEGDIQAAKILLERVLPPLKSQPETFIVERKDSLTEQGQSAINRALSGDITQEQANDLLTTLNNQAKLIEVEAMTQKIESIHLMLETMANAKTN